VTALTTLKSQPPVSNSQAAQEATSGYAWYVVFVLMTCYSLSFVNRQILSLLVAPIKHDLLISDTRIGLLQGFAFAVFYTFAGLPIGRIADRHSRRNIISVGVFLWSVMTSLSAEAASFWSLFATRMGVGIGEAALSPAAFSMISDYFERKRLSVALSVYSMGIFIGSGMALIVGGTVVDAVVRWKTVTLPVLGTIASWRLSFLAVGLPGFLFVLWLRTIKEPLRKNLLRSADGRVSHLSLRETLSQVSRRWKSVCGISFAMIFQSTCTFAFVGWAPTLLQRIHGWSAGRTGRALGLIIMIFGCTGMYLGGLLTDYWQQRNVHEAPLKTGALSAAGTGIFFVTSMLIPSVNWTLILAAPGMIFLGLAIGSSYASLQMIFPNQLRAQVSAFFLFVLNLGGLSLGPLLPGVFNDYLFRNEKMIGPSVALTIGVAASLQYILFRATYRPYRKDYDLMRSAVESI
jgi:MFS family permease